MPFVYTYWWQIQTDGGVTLLVPVSRDDVAFLVIGGQIGLLVAVVVVSPISTRFVIGCTLKSTKSWNKHTVYCGKRGQWHHS